MRGTLENFDFFYEVVQEKSATDEFFCTDYTPFGAVAKVWNNPDQTQQEAYRHGYQGQYSEADSTTGWNAFELRMYDPLIGRWMSTDPYNQFASPYLGMGNNPISQTDPDGGYSKFWAKWHAFWTPGVSASDIYEVDGEWGFNTVDYDLGGVVWNVGEKYTNYGYGNPGQGVIRPHQPNFAETLQNNINEAPLPVSVVGNALYGTVDNAYVSLFQLGGDRYNLAGYGVNNNEIADAGVGTLTTLIPYSKVAQLKGLNAAQFSSALKGTKLNQALYGISSSSRGFVNRVYNYFHKRQIDFFLKGSVTTTVVVDQNTGN